MWWPNDKLHSAETTRDGVGFIEEAAPTEPFFLTLSYFDPHPPYFAPPEHASPRSAEEMVVLPYVAPAELSGRLAEYQKALRFDEIKRKYLKATMEYYYAFIEWEIDKQVGRILQTVEEQGLTWPHFLYQMLC